jgi:16S rRNA (adenine1518-N6/adenine1519-N6)-dimethyltransferase
LKDFSKKREVMKYNKSKIEPKKRFGQNFLIDKSIISKIILAMSKDKQKFNSVVEIGPGLGDLTQELIAKARRVIAYEVDERLCEYLKNEFKDKIASNQLELNCGNVLEHWKNGSLSREAYYLVANLPYYIATNIIIKALEDNNCKGLLCMVQKEVAIKFTSNSGDREFNSLSILTQSCGDAKILFDVPPEAFNPPPKVTSSVIEIVKNSNLLLENDFKSFLKIAFSQPRKKLMKNLSLKYSKESLNKVFEKLSIDKSLRPHQVKTRIYHLIYKELKEYMDGKTSRFKKKRVPN